VDDTFAVIGLLTVIAGLTVLYMVYRGKL